MPNPQSASRSAGAYVSPHGGLVCRIRPLRGADAPLLADCFARLSIASRRLRFFSAKQTLSDGDGVVDYEMRLPEASPPDTGSRWVPDTAPLVEALEEAWIGTAEQAMRLTLVLLAAPFGGWAAPRPSTGA